MRILLINKYWRPVGGVEAHALVVEEALKANGHEVVHFATSHPENFPSATSSYFVADVDFRKGGVIGRLRGVDRAAFGRDSVHALRRLLDEVPIDAAHVLHAYHQLGMQILSVLRERSIPTVLSLHDYKVACPNYRYFSESSSSLCTRCLDHRSGFLWAPALTKCWDNSATAGAFLSVEATVNAVRRTYARDPGAVIYLNELQRRSLLSKGVPSAKLHHVPHFLELHDPPGPSARAGVLYVGRLVPEKGVGVLIKACASAGVALRIVGSGRDEEELKELARATPGAHVEFLGAQTQEEVRDHMSHAAVLAVPSVWPEVSPLVILEAIEAGLPVVGSRVGGIPDLLGEGRGMLCEPGDVDDLSSSLDVLAHDRQKGAEYASRAWSYAASAWTREKWWAGVSAAYRTAGARL